MNAEDEFFADLWREGILEHKLHESQAVIDSAVNALPQKAKEAVLLCSRRFGKSYYGCVRSLMRGIPQRKLIRIIGPDIKQTEMIVRYNMAKITDELSRIGLKDFVRYIKSEKMYVVGTKGSGIFLGGFDSQEDSLRGGEADEIFIEESGSSDPDQYTYQMTSVLKPQLLKTRGRMTHLTTPPRDPNHPFVLSTIPRAQLDGAYYEFDIFKDPLATPEIIADAIKDCGGEHTIEFQREYLVKIIRDPSIMVVPGYNDDLVAKPFVQPLQFTPHVTIDFGGVRDKTVALLHWWNFLDAKTEIWDERVFPPNTPTSWIIHGITQMEEGLPQKPIRFADAPGQVLVDLSNAGYVVGFPPKEDWQAGVNQMAVACSQDSIRIHPQCKFLRQSLKSGTFNEKRTDFARTEALGHCDALAALMYALRVQIKTNPYPTMNSWMGAGPPPNPEQKKVADALNPKSFGNSFGSGFTPKKFGTFGDKR